MFLNYNTIKGVICCTHMIINGYECLVWIRKSFYKHEWNKTHNLLFPFPPPLEYVAVREKWSELVLENRNRPNVPWRPWWIYIDGTVDSEPHSHDFFISYGEQEVSQLTGVNTVNSVVNKKWDTHTSWVGFFFAIFQVLSELVLCAAPR